MYIYKVSSKKKVLNSPVRQLEKKVSRVPSDTVGREACGLTTKLLAAAKAGDSEAAEKTMEALSRFGKPVTII